MFRGGHLFLLWTSRRRKGPVLPADLHSFASGRVAPHRVVIVGAGFAGLFAAKELRRADAEVTVIDRTNHHLFQPLLYQMATGILAEGDIALPIRDVLRRQRNASVMLGEVVAID